MRVSAEHAPRRDPSIGHANGSIRVQENALNRIARVGGVAIVVDAQGWPAGKVRASDYVEEHLITRQPDERSVPLKVQGRCEIEYDTVTCNIAINR